MNFKNICLIIPLLHINLKVIAGPVITEGVDLSFGNESEDEVFSTGEENDLNGDDVKVVDLFSDDENIATEIVNVLDEVEECSSNECIQTSKRMLEKLDISVDPCEDFYHFTCGGWESMVLSNEINSNDATNEVKTKTKNEIREIIEGEYIIDEKLSKEDQAYDEKTFKKLKNIYNICVNKEINESYPNEHLINFVKNLNISENKDKLKDPKELANLFVKLQTNGVDSLVNINVMINSDIAYTPVVGLTYNNNLISRSSDYSLPDKLPESVPVIKDYIKSIITIIHGEKNNINSIVDNIYDIERKLSKIYQESQIETILMNLGNGIKPDNMEILKFNELNEKYSMINWESYVKDIFEFYNLSELITDDMIIYNLYPTLYEGLNKLISEMTVDDIVNYLEWYVISMSAFDDYVSEDIIKTKENYINKIKELSSSLIQKRMNESYSSNISDGSTQFKSLQRRNVTEPETKSNKNVRYSVCSKYIKNVIPMVISKYFIQKNFNDDYKKEVKNMVDNIKKAMINRIPKIEWLDDETKEYAIQKGLKMIDKIGYPDEIMDPKKLYQMYEDLEINNLFNLIIKSNISSFGKNLKYLDKNEWLMEPYNVNAYYYPVTNSFYLPAAILQSPFYSTDEQDYINYSSSGSIIGHEITHAFDNFGRLYGAEGNLNNWWSDNDNKEFSEYAQCFIDEYNAITYDVGNEKVNVNGERTLGENLADNGGLARAYEAWQLSLLENPEKAARRNKKLPGFENYTIDQLFYIAYGQLFCSINTKKENDVHPPGIARVNGVVANSEHFAKTFNCPRKSSMNPEKKCIIW